MPAAQDIAAFLQPGRDEQHYGLALHGLSVACRDGSPDLEGLVRLRNAEKAAPTRVDVLGLPRIQLVELIGAGLLLRWRS